MTTLCALITLILACYQLFFEGQFSKTKVSRGREGRHDFGSSSVCLLEKREAEGGSNQPDNGHFIMTPCSFLLLSVRDGLLFKRLCFRETFILMTEICALFLA